MTNIQKAAAALGRRGGLKGGLSTSPKKRKAARLNAAKATAARMAQRAKQSAS